MFIALPAECFRQPGEFEKAALRRERDQLWRDRFHLTPDQGRRLDFLIAKIGTPDDAMSDALRALQQEKASDKAAQRLGFEPWGYTERS